jgi:hypothetical protein
VVDPRNVLFRGVTEFLAPPVSAGLVEGYVLGELGDPLRPL